MVKKKVQELAWISLPGRERVGMSKYETGFWATSPTPNLVSERAVALRRRLSAARWEEVAREALHRLDVLEGVRRYRRKTGSSLRASVRAFAPDLDWSTYLGWRRRLETRPGPAWERLIDGRVPPPRPPVGEDVAQAAIWLRRAASTLTCSAARALLMKEFEERGRVSDSSLRRIWGRAGLSVLARGDASRFERVERIAGGGGLAFIGAAALEFAGMVALAVSAQAHGRDVAAVQTDVQEERSFNEHRDRKGRFTAAYNEAWREGIPQGVADERWGTDLAKSAHVDLSQLQVLALRPETLSNRMLAIGMIPLVTDRRGFDGLDGPRARWLIAAGIHDYRPATLDKTLTELAQLQTSDALWHEYGRQWSAKAREWSAGGPKWYQVVTYVDITSDPYWTRRYALSGKVSRVGRVMPCLSRVAVMGGCGFPLFMDTRAGTTSLKATLIAALAITNNLDGVDEMSHLTIVDAEAASFELLTTLNDIPGHDFITVLKGPAARGVVLQEATAWQPYRDEDQIRAGHVVLQGSLKLFAVEMLRPDSRHPHPTMFITSVRPDMLASHEICNAYLSRWPHQEARFKEFRNGAGLEHSHGFGGAYIVHAALPAKREAAERKVDHVKQELEDAKRRLDTASLLKKSAAPAEKPDLQALERQAKKEITQVTRAMNAADKAKTELESTPDKIFQRDTGRENIATVLNLTVAMLLEWVLREYFGSTKMELRTFLEYFLYLPTEIRTRANRVLYRIDTRGLPPGKADLVHKACAEITRRKLRRDGRLLVFEPLDALAHSQ